jgi:hypothetical protein
VALLIAEEKEFKNNPTVTFTIGIDQKEEEKSRTRVYSKLYSHTFPSP